MSRPDFNDRCDQSRALWAVITVTFVAGAIALLCGWHA